MIAQSRSTEAFVDEYLKQNPPYHSSENLGVNVSEIMRYAKQHGKKAKELSELELLQVLR